MEQYTDEIVRAIETLREARIDAAGGLSQELFWLVSSLTPIVNVDLLITNRQNQLLLARRNDEFHPKCWHIPGGCIRFGETMLERVHKTAVSEIGCDVSIEPCPIATRDALREPVRERSYPNERRHFVSVLFRCALTGEVQNRDLTENDAGYLKWFDRLPKDLVPIQHIYDDVLSAWE